MIALSDFLILGALLFTLSMAGIFLNRKNVRIVISSQRKPAHIVPCVV